MVRWQEGVDGVGAEHQGKYPLSGQDKDNEWKMIWIFVQIQSYKYHRVSPFSTFHPMM